MTTEDFISELFCRIDDAMQTVPKHPQASLWPNEVVTLGVVFALKGVGTRPFFRWLVRDYRALFPRGPGSSGSSRPIEPGPPLSWLPPPCCGRH